MVSNWQKTISKNWRENEKEKNKKIGAKMRKKKIRKLAQKMKKVIRNSCFGTFSDRASCKSRCGPATATTSGAPTSARQTVMQRRTAATSPTTTLTPTRTPTGVNFQGPPFLLRSSRIKVDFFRSVLKRF
jgi:hypothetical protein